jgi:hypothetical protein
MNTTIENQYNINQTIINGFGETNIDIQRLLEYEDKIHSFIK